VIWLDAQLSPQLARWIAETFGNECVHVRDLGLRDAEDSEIFQKARDAGSVVLTKDEDFVRLVERNSSPPQVIWLTAGNMSNSRLKSLLLNTFPDAMSLIANGETVVEIHQAK
jgi:predicted nuclease of predicted toxin-antitoxin system